MCGIAGILAGPQAPTVSFEELRRMIALVAHRGPDGYGLYRDDRVGLAHARLSLVDLAGGHQPIRNADGTLWLSFNGEVFNYVELRRRLARLGHRFYTEGDGEAIVHCYERYGEAAWEMLNGQFAFALWDSRRRKLWLVRDRVGILPLFWTVADGHLLFASEAKALFAGSRLAPSIDPAGLAETFTAWAATAPATVFRGVRQVPPATALCFGPDLRPAEHRYWRPDPTRQPAATTPDAAAEALEELLDHAIALRLRADVPVGAYVSGGLDSSVIGSLAVARAGAATHTFGIRFADSRFDETAEQRLVAGWLATRHHEILCDGADIRDALAEVVWHAETPLLRTAPVPMFLLSAQVREAGIKTVLTGEGADELLAGYTIFKEDAIRRFWARQPHSRLRPALLARIHHYVGSDRARTTGLWRDFFRRDLEAVDHPFYSHLIRWRNTAWTLRLLAPDIRAAWDLDSALAAAAADLPADWAAWDPLARAQMIEMQGFLSSYLLASQGDRVAMAHAVEARYPFLDPAVIDFCLSLPRGCKMAGLRDKLALRRLAAHRGLPAAVWTRRKQPFRAPIGEALFGPGAQAFHDLLAPAALEADGLLGGAAVAALAAKARRHDGRMGGEREEMGLVGVLTLRLLSHQFGPAFAGRAAQARDRLARIEPTILIDRAAPALSA